jgi:hypothetical protein
MLPFPGTYWYCTYMYMIWLGLTHYIYYVLVIDPQYYPSTNKHTYVFTDTTLDLTAPMTANRWHWESLSIQVVPSLPARAFMKPCMVWLFRTPPNPWFNGIAFPVTMATTELRNFVNERTNRRKPSAKPICRTMGITDQIRVDATFYTTSYQNWKKWEWIRAASQMRRRRWQWSLEFRRYYWHSTRSSCTVVWSVVQKALPEMRTMQETIWRQRVRWLEEKEGEMEMTGLCYELWHWNTERGEFGRNHGVDFWIENYMFWKC